MKAITISDEVYEKLAKIKGKKSFSAVIDELIKRNVEKRVEMLIESSFLCEDLLVSSLTVYELLVEANYVFKKYGNAKELMVINEILKPLTPVSIDFDIVNRASAIKADAILIGLDVPDMDILIACSGEDAEILTFDRDFSPLEDLGFKVTVLGNNNG